MIKTTLKLLLLQLVISVSIFAQSVTVLPGEENYSYSYVFSGDGNDFGFYCAYNEGKAMVSLTFEVLNATSSLVFLDTTKIAFYYGGQWVNVADIYATMNTPNSTPDLKTSYSASNYYSSGYPSYLGAANGTEKIAEAFGSFIIWGSFSIPYRSQLYLKNYNNLELYDTTYLPIAGKKQNRLLPADNALYSIRTRRYSPSYAVPVKNPANSSGVAPVTAANNITTTYYGNLPGVVNTEAGAAGANQRYITINFTNLPPDMISSPGFRVHMYQNQQGTNANNRIYEWVYNNKNFMTNGPNSLTASNNNCTGVVLNWANGQNSAPTDGTPIFKTVVLRNGAYLATVGNNVNTYTDVTAAANTIYDYKILHVAFSESGDTYYKSPLSSTVSGGRKPSPDEPISPHATEDDCAGNIDLSWSYNGSNPQFFRVDTASSATGTFGTLIDSLSGASRSYNHSSVIRGKRYYYKIYSVNNCGAVSLSAATTNGVSPTDPAMATNISVTNIGSTMSVSWTDNATNEDKYELLRIDDGGNTVFTVLNPNTTSYVDNTVASCREYTYKVKVFNSCVPSGIVSDSSATSTLPPPNVTSTFNQTGNYFTGSKGYFVNRVELNWDNENNGSLDAIKIQRKILGSASPAVNIASVTPGTQLYVDNNADAGVFYEYSIFGEMYCLGVTYQTDTITDVGFRSASGLVSGHVDYTGGTAVPNVKISVEPDNGSSGFSLQTSAGNSGSIPHSTMFDFTSEFTLETFVKFPNATANVGIISKTGSFDLTYLSSDQLRFQVTTGSGTQNVFYTNPIDDNLYHQITAVYYGDSIRLIVDGVIANAAATNHTGNVIVNTNNITIGNVTAGTLNLDEMRIYNQAKTDLEIERDFSRVLKGTGSGLIAYYRFNEGAGNFFYDNSYVGNVYSENHGTFVGTPTFSSTIPLASQLAFAGYTNLSGDYSVPVNYNGIGEIFNIVPSFPGHSFTPSSTSVYIGDNSQIQNGVDFVDQSSFAMEGTLIFGGTICPVEGASVKVDGNSVVVAGSPVLTAADGTFNIQVPIGNHVVTVEKNGHVMSAGRFPPTGTWDFQEDVSGVVLRDTTLIKVVGRVVGGLRESQYLPGFGKSTNNLGIATIDFTPTMGGGCTGNSFSSDSVTGEYIAMVPPMNYTVDASVASGPSFTAISLDLSTVPTLETVYDTISYDSVAMTYDIDSVKFHKQLDFIHRNTPKIELWDLEDSTVPYIGLKEFVYETSSGISDTLDLTSPSSPIPWALLDGRNEGAESGALIYVFEEYVNASNGIVDKVPTTDGVLNFNNELAASPIHSVNMSDVNTLDSIRNLIYTFKIGKPNFNTNTFPEISYTKKMEIYLTTSSGVVHWKPDNYNGTSTSTYITSSYDGTFRAYILGVRAEGQQFITSGPSIPEYVLRDPPGSNSFASREVGTTKTSENSWSWSLGASTNSTDKIFLGSKFQVGLGVAVETDIKNNVSVGFSTSQTGGETGTESTVETNTETWSTNASEFSPGRSSDLYIGKAKNITFGVSETFTMMPTSDCQGTCVSSSQTPGFSFAVNAGLSIVPGGYATQFMYSEEDIKSFIIPDLITLRNNMLTSNSKYSNVALLPSDPNYGLNNDDLKLYPSLPQLTSDGRISYIMNLADSVMYDTIFNNTGGVESIEEIIIPSASQAYAWAILDSLKNPGFEVLAGPSYTYSAVDRQDSLTGDSVRWVNNQIRQWENAIMLNEWEKVNIDNAALKTKLKEVELSKLYGKYEEVIQKYKELSKASTVTQNTAAALSLIPVPGAGIATGVVGFAIGSGTGISAAKIYDQYTRYQLDKQVIENKFSEAPVNKSISGGVAYTSSMTHESASTHANNIEYGMSTALELEIGVQINNTGFGLNRSIGVDYSSGRDWSSTSSSTETVAYTLFDQDQNDLFSVDVFPSILGWGPIFKLKPGGRTACPHEGQALTEYYLDDPANSGGGNVNFPSFELHAGTQQIERVEISSSASLLTNIPITNAAVFDLTLTNTSQTNDDVEYRLRVDPASNPFGAYVKIDGVVASTDVLINGGSSINKVLTVEKGPGPVHEYDSILVLVHSLCQYDPTSATDDFPDIVDSVYVSAHFIPSCTEISFNTPDDNWVQNNDANESMAIIMEDYDVNFFGFEAIELQYKPSAASSWIELQKFYQDTTGLNDTTALLIASGSPFTSWDWNTAQISDGHYDLRLISQCALATKVSVIHSGVIDTQNPETFGTPSPADGILDPNDDIFIQFNEPIESGVLSNFNFDVRGVKNRTASSPTESLNFDGVADYALVNGGANLRSRSFTFEFNAKLNVTGIDQVVFSQSLSPLQSLTIGFDATNKFKFSLGAQSVVSDVAVGSPTDWHHYAVVYDYTNGVAMLYVDGAIVNSGGLSLLFDYTGEGKLAFGKEIATNSKFFNGNLRGVRLWNDVRTSGEISTNYTYNLQGNESGLLYNWRFDEVEGNLAVDHVRSRNADLYGTTWEVTPNGNAGQFDGVDDYLSAQAARNAINSEMDFTLEFWFRSTQAGAATLFSNGNGDGLQSDSLTSWNIAKDAAGMIHVYHNGLDFIATNQNYFDGNWHHFALVLNRTANITSYIDGNIEKATTATAFSQMGGPSMYIGAHGYSTGGPISYDNFYQGDMDEFRFWNTARKLEQIKRDRINRILGNELGLKLYVPFENYQSVLGSPILTSTFEDQTTVVDTVTASGGVAMINQTPTIRLPRPIQAIGFNYSVNNDKIIITPTVNPADIENVTLDITVENVYDLNGNKMQSPETWIAYVNKNQVLWQDVEYNFTKTEDSVIVFNTNIVNTGGASKSYTIAGLPAWLSVDNATGVIGPNASKTVQFTIASGYAVGEYFADVTLTTDFGYDEKLALNLEVVGDAPDWTVDPSGFAFSMIIFGELEIDGVLSTNPNSMLAAFINDTICGVANLQYLPAYDRYEVFMNVYSNAVTGDSVKFQIYDASSGYTFVNVTPNLMFTENAVFGSVPAPITFQTTSTIALDIPLNNGWTWISLPLESNQLNSSNALADGLSNTSGDVIKGLFNYDQYDLSNGWLGGLSANGGYTNSESYKYNRTSKDTLTLVGKRIHPDSSFAQINLTQGWNWIGYVSTKISDVNTALGQYTATTGDIIKSQYQFAYYDNTLGWVGSLTDMKPGLGYMFQAVNPGSFTYPLSLYYGKSASEFAIKEVKLPVQYSFTPEVYSKTMSIVAEGNVCKEALATNDVVLAAMDQNGNMRGFTTPKMIDNKYYFFLTVYANENDELLNYKYINVKTGEDLVANETILFENNLLKGTMESSSEANVDPDLVCKLFTQEELEEETLSTNDFNCYPNPFTGMLTIQFEKEVSVDISVVDMLGRTVYSARHGKIINTNLDLSSDEIAAGLYTLKITGDIESVTKLVKRK